MDYTLSLHDALPISLGVVRFVEQAGGQRVVGVDGDLVAVGHVAKHLE